MVFSIINSGIVHQGIWACADRLCDGNVVRQAGRQWPLAMARMASLPSLVTCQYHVGQHLSGSTRWLCPPG